MIYILIPVHNRKIFTRDCLASLDKQTCKDYKLVVIDDGSSDGTREMLAAEFPGVTVLTGDGNLWWTRSINKGVDYALKRGSNNDYILTLNNDLIVNEDYLSSLLSCTLAHPGSLIGSVSVDINDNERIYDGGVSINFWTAKHRVFNQGEKLSAILRESSGIFPVSTLPGRGTLIPFQVFTTIGLYNFKHFPHYGADYEFSARARKAGFNLLINYKAVVKSHIRETGISKAKVSIRDYFFNIRSSSSLSYRYHFALNISSNPLQILSYLLFDTGRNLYRYARGLIGS